jgi:hypothetical protein
MVGKTKKTETKKVENPKEKPTEKPANGLYLSTNPDGESK